VLIPGASNGPASGDTESRKSRPRRNSLTGPAWLRRARIDPPPLALRWRADGAGFPGTRNLNDWRLTAGF